MSGLDTVLPEIYTLPPTESVREGEVVPTPKFPLSNTVIFSAFEESARAKILPVPVPLPVTESFALGVVVPMPTLPPLSTMNLVAVEEPMTNAGPVTRFGLTDNNPQGELEAMPTE